MKRHIGADLGGSAVKLVCTDRDMNILARRRYVTDGNSDTFESELNELLLDAKTELSDTEICAAGVGSGLLKSLPLKARYISEFEAFGRGGRILSGLDEALVVSIGTGTAFVSVRDDTYTHLGGTGIGGGTMCGLSLLLTGEKNIFNIKDMASRGNKHAADLTVGDISIGAAGDMADLTASNFGKADIDLSGDDIAAALANMVYESIGVMSAFCCKSAGFGKAVFVGAMSDLTMAEGILSAVGKLHSLDFIVPDNGAFAGAIGAASTLIV